MFNFEIYRLNWMFFSVGTGLILAIMIVLTYVAIWKTRPGEKEPLPPIKNVRTFFVWFLWTFPWALILVLAATWLLGITYPFIRAANPPNW